MPKQRLEPAPQIIARPIEPPEGASIFRLRRDGKSGPACFALHPGGAEKDLHPIAWFTTATILEKWGYHDLYTVQFWSVDEERKRHTLGPPSRFRLPDPEKRRAEGIAAASLPPAAVPEAAGLQRELGSLLSLKSIVDQDSASRIAAAERSAQASVRVAEIQAEKQMAWQSKMFELLMPAKGPTRDPLLERLLEAQERTDRRMDRLFEALAQRDAGRADDDEKEEEEDDSDDARIERFRRLYKKKGGSFEVVKEFLGEETVMGLITLLPKIKAKMPEFIERYGSMLQGQMKAALEAPAAPSPPAAVAPSASQVVRPLKKRRPPAEDAPPATPRSAQAIQPDEHVLKVR